MQRQKLYGVWTIFCLRYLKNTQKKTPLSSCIEKGSQAISLYMAKKKWTVKACSTPFFYGFDIHGEAEKKEMINSRSADCTQQSQNCRICIFGVGGAKIFCDKFLQKKRFLIWFSLTLSQIINPWKPEVAKVRRSFSILILQMTLSEIWAFFWPIFNLNDVIKIFATYLCWHYKLYWNIKEQTNVNYLNRVYIWFHWKNDVIFRNYGSNVTMMTSLTKNCF